MSNKEDRDDNIVVIGQDATEKPQDEEGNDTLKSRVDIVENARAATEKEHNMTLWQGIKLYPTAIAFSVIISTCIVMEGYDICLINNFCTPLLLFGSFPSHSFPNYLPRAVG